MVVSNRYNRPSFCDGCGIAYPWATREERIYELENLFDEAGIDEADRVVIHDPWSLWTFRILSTPGGDHGQVVSVFG